MSSSLKIEESNFDETEKRLQLLYQITSQTSSSLDEQLNKALELTAELLGMDVAIISSISEETNVYKIRNFHPADLGLSIGQTFDLGNTYCSITLESDKVVAINRMKESEYERHPCYEIFALESYIGIPILIDSELYGTINFSSPDPKKGGFVPSDYTLIKLLGEWVAATVKRARTVKELKEKNNRLELISRNSADLICLHNLDGVYEFVSPSVENILGFTYEELLGKNHTEFIHKEDLEYLEGEPLQILEKEGVVTNTRYRIRNKEGEYIWFESSVKIIRGDDNKAIGVQSVSRDVSERKKLETMFEQAQQIADVGGWEFDLETGDIFWTDEVYRIHEKEIGSELDLTKGMDHFPGDAKIKLGKAINEAIEFGKKYDLVLPFVTEKDAKKWVRAIGIAHSRKGKVRRLSGTFQDITKQIKSEKRIISQNEELLRLTETRDKLYSIIAHDLKGAFFGINGMLELLIEKTEEELDKEKIEEINRNLNLLHGSSQNAFELLENMLDWIKIQGGSISVEKELVDLENLLNNALSLFESSIQKKKITIEKKFYPISINADKNILSTVLRNLISNAIKFTPKNGQIILKVNEIGKSIEISVIDSGIGMPKEIKDRLFDKENRPQRRGTSHEKGTGLGLLLSQDLINAHDGVISVTSEENEGSEFTVSLAKS